MTFLSLKKKPIQKVTFLKTTQDPEIASKKTSIVDILCEDENGSTYIVEMQVAGVSGFEKGALYYASKTYSSQANIGDQYDNLKEVIFLAVADYVVFPEKKEYKSDHVILDKKTYDHDLKDFSFTFIELPKFTKTIEEISTPQEKWCYFFKYAEETSPEDLERLIGKDVIMRKVYHELDRFYWKENELFAYEREEKANNDYLSSMKKSFTDGKAEGKAEGIAKGIAQGISKERAQAEKEKILTIKELARNLRKQGVSTSIIHVTTGLSEEEIESL